MNSRSPVRLFLVAGSNDTRPSNQEWRTNLEPLLQRWLDPFALGEVPNCSIFRALAKAGWPFGDGRKMRLEIGAQLIGASEVKFIELSSDEELNELVGDNRTLSDFLGAFGSLEPASAPR
jgi:hypothetical protein